MSIGEVVGKPAFGACVESHRHEIYVYLWRMLANDQDAEDCLQEVFLKAYRAYGRLDDRANVRAWLYRIAGNQARSYLRRRNRRDSRELELRHARAVNDLSTARAVERGLQLQEVRDAVEALPFKQRQALILRRYQELEYAEIAQVLGCSEDAARANVYQALKKMRARFAPGSPAFERAQ